jgi:glycosyltransferase involved in cell wall biosynthesis
MQMQVDSWTTGLRGDIVQRPLIEALMADGRVNQRLIFADEAASRPVLAATGLPFLTTPANRNPLNILQSLHRISQARASLWPWYEDNQRLVHVVMSSPWDQVFLDIPKRKGAKILLTVHDAQRHIGEESVFHSALESRLIEIADHVAVLSSYAGEVLRRRIGSRRPVHVVAPGLVMDSRAPGPSKTPPIGRPLKLLFFGRIHKYKGLDILLDAWERLHLESAPPVELTVVGSGDISPYRDMLARNPDVRLMHGWISDAEMERVFADNDVNILPYREGSLSATALAGMWAGMPTIATPIACFNEQLRNGVNALYSDDISAGAIAACIRRLAQSPELYARLARGAREKAISLSAPAVANNWHDLYREILSERRS